MKNMVKREVIFNLLVVLCLFKAQCCEEWYWKDYNREIPTDAIVAGTYKGQHRYIGQAYLHHYGIMVTTIIPGQNHSIVACYGVKKVNKMIKILCSRNHHNFHWIETTPNTYLNDTMHLTTVIGGYNERARSDWNKNGVSLELAPLIIGRTTRHVHPIIGAVTVYRQKYVGKTDFYYPDPVNNTVLSAASFEVLVYK
ncbi:unnamed protein product [Acanthoscelides obtectus]|uniref:Uncharacterized protein n=1 Tax=Acanthoscelides obtectus TaxID=200917 RepID=A0A9P0Q2Q5_ACAOB|nr:unnamed protein product [Acanthoscelides obtectus]CAK1686017.1 hypothetical protein AOBTE_LOCUS35757 [Acanthoscelides obtectus]